MKPIRPSFSRASRWKIGLDVMLRTLLMLAVIAMVNFLGTKFFHRFFLSQQTNYKLSSRTVGVLDSLTNQVNVTLYFDHHADFYPDIVALLNEYHAVNPKISIRTVDYLSDPGEAEKVKEKYNLTGNSDKNLVIFDYGSRWKVYSGDALVQRTLEQIPNEKEREFRRKPVAFAGEMVFTAMLLSLENPQSPKAYFLQGQGEPSLTDSGNFGYLKFGALLGQNYLTVTNLELSGQSVPADCNLLIIAGPSTTFEETDLQKIDQYLREGGRLLVLFNYASLQHPTGLEPILQHWGVNVAADIVKDPSRSSEDLVISKYGDHPIVSALAQIQLQIVLPRPVSKINWQTPPPNPPKVDELIFSPDNCVLSSDRTEPPQSYPLACAVEQKPVVGTPAVRGNARIVVVGDSLFLGNYAIEAGGNRDFLNAIINWLVERPQLVQGISPRPVTEYRLLLSPSQEKNLRWLLLGALPGGILIFGWFVWLVRRK